MRKLLLLAGAAALGIAAPGLAEKGGNGKGGGGGGKPQAAQGGGGGGGGKGGGGPRADKVRGPDKQMVRQESRGPKADKVRGPERQAFREAKPDRGPKADKIRGPERQAFREAKPDRGSKAERRQQRVDVQRASRDDLRVRGGGGEGYYAPDGRYSYAGGDCPPGLAKKNNGCLPPGQAKSAFRIGERIQPTWLSGYTIPDSYNDFYQDSADYYYRYDGYGSIYRIDSGSNLVSALIPLLGGGFAVGQPIPAGYDVYNVPYQYRDNYYDTDESWYRYGDNAIYEVDPQTGIIESIVALLGGNLGVGSMLPSGYDAYNVPMDYRDEYYDTNEHLYRYADGNIYQVDAQTQIIQAIVEMLV